MQKYLKWIAAAAAAAAVAGLQALATAVGIPVADLSPVVQAAIAAGVIKLVSWVISKIPVNA